MTSSFVRWTPDDRPPRLSDPPRPGLLLDRDGCLVVDEAHLADPAGLVPLRGAQDAVARAGDRGLRVAVATNQSVVGRGLVTPADMTVMHARLVDLFPAIEVVYHCPHLPGAGCPCRKPLPAMPSAAVRDLGLDPERTTMVGDKLTDVAAGRAAGVAAVLVRTGYGASQAAAALDAGIPVVDALADVVDDLVAP